jgi:hypothetical protein
MASAYLLDANDTGGRGLFVDALATGAALAVGEASAEPLGDGLHAANNADTASDVAEMTMLI